MADLFEILANIFDTLNIKYTIEANTDRPDKLCAIISGKYKQYKLKLGYSPKSSQYELLITCPDKCKGYRYFNFPSEIVEYIKNIHILS